MLRSAKKHLSSHACTCICIRALSVRGSTEGIDNLTDRWPFNVPADLIGLSLPLSLFPSPSLPLALPPVYVHSRRFARRREGTTIIYEGRKSRSIDLSDRSCALAHALAQAAFSYAGLSSPRKHFDEGMPTYDATITAITVTLVELYRANTISLVRCIRVHISPVHASEGYYFLPAALLPSVTIYHTLSLYIPGTREVAVL